MTTGFPHDHRSRHLPQTCPAQAHRGGLGRRAPLLHRAEDLHRWPHRGHRREGQAPPQKRADYLLRYTRDFTIAVVEAKAEYKTAGEGLQQAKDYAEILGLKFAYATNGHGIVEFDYLTGQERCWIASRRPTSSGSAGKPDSRSATAVAQVASDPGTPPQRQDPSLLPGNRHQPHGAGHPAG